MEKITGAFIFGFGSQKPQNNFGYKIENGNCFLFDFTEDCGEGYGIAIRRCDGLLSDSSAVTIVLKLSQEATFLTELKTLSSGNCPENSLEQKIISHGEEVSIIIEVPKTIKDLNEVVLFFPAKLNRDLNCTVEGSIHNIEVS